MNAFKVKEERSMRTYQIEKGKKRHTFKLIIFIHDLIVFVILSFYLFSSFLSSSSSSFTSA